MLDGVSERIDEILREWSARTTGKQRITWTLVHAQLLREGYRVGSTTVRAYLAEKRRLLRASRTLTIAVRDSFAPFRSRVGTESSGAQIGHTNLPRIRGAGSVRHSDLLPGGQP